MKEFVSASELQNANANWKWRPLSSAWPFLRVCVKKARKNLLPAPQEDAGVMTYIQPASLFLAVLCHSGECGLRYLFAPISRRTVWGRLALATGSSGFLDILASLLKSKLNGLRNFRVQLCKGDILFRRMSAIDSLIP
jgi:hypothetical protein